MPVSLFDAKFYRASNPDLAGFSDAQALQHFQNHGLNEGRAFSPLADLNFYRSSNPDLASAGLTTNQKLYDHLRNYGVAEGRRFSEFTDINYYLAANSDVRQAFAGSREQAFNHLRTYGVAEGRQFSQFIDINYYLAANSDVRQAFSGDRVQALQHLEIYGLREGRQFDTEFSTSFYRNVYSDLSGLTNIQLLRHFESYGLKEGRASSETFNVQVYLANNADLKAAGLSNQQALEHFGLYGQREGRLGADYAGNATTAARAVGALTSTRTFFDFVGRGDDNDYYQFSLSAASSVSVSLGGLRADVNVRLLNSSGSTIQTSANAGITAETITRALDAGTYYIQVYSASTSASSHYSLNLSTTPSPAVDTSLYWTRQLGTTDDDVALDVAVDGAGNVYTTGWTQNSLGGTNAGGFDAWVSKYSSGGVLQWTRQLGDSSTDYAWGVAVDNSGSVYITGQTFGSLGGINQGSIDAFIAKYDANGNQQWVRQLGTSGYDYGFDISIDTSGYIYVTGAWEESGASDGDAFVAKYSSDGTRQWLQQLGTSSVVCSYGIAIDSTNNILITGFTNGSLSGVNAGLGDAFVAKYSNSGTLQWVRQLGGSNYDNAQDVAVDSAGNVYITGSTEGSLAANSSGNADAWLAKYSSSGSLQWTRQWGTSNRDLASAVDIDRFGNVYVGGRTEVTAGSATPDTWINKYGSDGTLQWAKQFGIVGQSSIRELAIDSSGNLYVAGQTSNPADGRYIGRNDAWVAKYQVDQAGSVFNSTYGYGLVNAAAAVARALGQPIFADVADLGGTNWGNDLVKAPEAWARGYTGQGITVAVIDSGVDITHSDLSANIWRNTREIANNGIDDDRNGYIDDVNGWNFGANNSNVMPGSMTSSGNGHGTHVAGTIAAVNNGSGITGVAYNSKIMAIKIGEVSSNNHFINPGSLATAIRYAVDNGARVINMSVGWSDSPELGSAMAYAASRNVITVSSAGNSSSPTPGNPAAYATQYGISVGAVDGNRTIARFSNRAGTDSAMQHVVALGVGVYSTLPGNTYASWDGTSMAAPHVAGVVALMLSANPNLTASQVRQIVTSSATGFNFSSLTAATSGAVQEASL